MIALGIDPGKNGGIALVGVYSSTAWKIPETERDLYTLLENAVGTAHFAMIERVASSPQMGVRSAFTFGRGVGLLRGFLVALGVPFSDVAPGVWQRKMRCLSGGDKNVTKARAQELFPDLKITHATADALLIAEYCRRTRLVAGSAGTSSERD